MDWLLTAVGALLVLAVLRDVFHTLWHPTGEGTLHHLISASLWRAVRRLGHGARAVAGPGILTVVVLVWGALLILGWALIYLPRLPDGFSYDSALDLTARGGLVDAIYLSTVVLGTLGFGDIVPTEPWLRLLTPVQALVGFALLTASVSWVLQIQPALGRRRSLARHLTMLRGAQQDTGCRELPAAELTGIAARLTRVHVDLRQSSPTFYFVERETAEALPCVLPYVRELADRAAAADDDDLRLAGAALERVLTGLARLLGDRFLRVGQDAGTDEVLRRFAAEHGHPADVAVTEPDAAHPAPPDPP